VREDRLEVRTWQGAAQPRANLPRAVSEEADPEGDGVDLYQLAFGK